MSIPIPTYLVVLVLIERERQYVLIREAMPERGFPWFLPAGRVEVGESIPEAAKREAMEEAGLRIKPTAIMKIEHVIPEEQDQHHPKPELWRFVVVAEEVGGRLKEKGDAHSIEARWFKPEETWDLPLRAYEAVELIEEHRRGAPLLPIEACARRGYWSY